MDLRYPVGEFDMSTLISPDQRPRHINEIAQAPMQLREAINDLTAEQLDTQYRPDGWTVRQVVHHLPDSHLNSYTRFKLALTEEEPTIKPYREERWAELFDAKHGDPDISLSLLDSLHKRWVILLESMSDEEYSRSFHHLELGKVRLDTSLGFYAWHCRHHIAHITSLRVRKGWKI